MRLAEKIKDYRQKNGISQRDFAAKAHLSNGYLSQLEAEKSRNTGRPIVPTLTALNGIALAMGTTIDALLAELDDMPVDISNNRKNMSLSEEEATLIEAFRDAPIELKDAVFRLVIR